MTSVEGAGVGLAVVAGVDVAVVVEGIEHENDRPHHIHRMS